MKNLRQEKMIEFINKYDIETQDALLLKLREAGFDVTQATVSRDIKELKLVKVATGKGGYRYAERDEGSPNQEVKYLNIMKETIKSVKNANNLVVIKTFTGMAQAACAAVDSVYEKDVLGSIAGDDTIIIVSPSNDHAAELVGQITEKIGNKKSRKHSET